MNYYLGTILWQSSQSELRRGQLILVVSTVIVLLWGRKLSVIPQTLSYKIHAVLLQQHVQDPSHSAKSAGGRLQPNTIHSAYVALNEMTL